MTFYIRVPLVAGGTVRGKIERMAARDNATEMDFADAKDYHVQAFVTWTGLDWQIERVSETKYIVKGEQH